jgi:hypothetical protein
MPRVCHLVTVARVHQTLQPRWISKRELARLLVPHGFNVSGETLNRWVREGHEMEPAMVRALETITGLRLEDKEEAPRPAEPDGALERLLSDVPPPWAQRLADQILNGIEQNRLALLEQAAAQFAALGDLLRGPDNDDAGPQGNRGPQPGQPGPPKGR